MIAGRRHQSLPALALVAALAATACTGDDPAATTTVTASSSATPTPSATTTRPSPTPTSSSSPTPTASPSPTPTTTPLVAEPTGLRAITLGDPAAAAVAELQSRLGPPDADSGWGPAANSPFGVCPGATTGGQVRGVRWGRVRLLFSDADTDHGSAGTKHLMAYDLTSFQGSRSAPTTAAGIGLGSTAADLQAAYGGDVTFHPADETLPDRFTIDFDADGTISGSLDAPPPDGVVTFVTAGATCGE